MKEVEPKHGDSTEKEKCVQRELGGWTTTRPAQQPATQQHTTPSITTTTTIHPAHLTSSSLTPRACALTRDPTSFTSHCAAQLPSHPDPPPPPPLPLFQTAHPSANPSHILPTHRPQTAPAGKREVTHSAAWTGWRPVASTQGVGSGGLERVGKLWNHSSS